MEWLGDRLRGRGAVVIAGAGVLILAAAVFAGMALLRGFRPPPSIFDAPATDVAGYLTSRDFSALSIEERLKFITGLVERFRGMSQSDSAVVAAFFAGLTGPMKEQLRDNVRILGKDIIVEGASTYIALKTEAERGAFLDQWLVKWARFGRELSGRKGPAGPEGGDEEILGRLRRQARRDAERGFEFNEGMAQQVIDFWESDISKVTTPTEQGQVFKFLPAVRDHLLKQKKS